MSVQTDPVPPVPEHTAPLTEDLVSPTQGKLFSHPWTRWFTSIREKINVLNNSLVQLSVDLPSASAGILANTGTTWLTRILQGTSDRIKVTNGDGVAGDPAVDLEPSGVISGTYNNVNITVDSFGRVTSISSGPSIPPGGTTGQVLTKVSGADYDYTWQ